MKKWLIERVLSKLAPDRIPRTGEEANNVDCNVMYVIAQDASWKLLASKITNTGLVGKKWTGVSFDEDVEISFEELKNAKYEITHFFKIYDMQFNSLQEYLLKDVFPYYKVKIFLRQIDQFLFNRQDLIPSERVEVLKVILEKTIDNSRFDITPVNLMGIMHGYRWVFHPDKDRQVRYNRLLLESLVCSGELKAQDGGYVLTEKALLTIASYELENTRYKQNLFQSKAMKWLTLALIFVGLTQAYVGYLGIQGS